MTKRFAFIILAAVVPILWTLLWPAKALAQEPTNCPGDSEFETDLDGWTVTVGEFIWTQCDENNICTGWIRPVLGSGADNRIERVVNYNVTATSRLQARHTAWNVTNWLKLFFSDGSVEYVFSCGTCYHEPETFNYDLSAKAGLRLVKIEYRGAIGYPGSPLRSYLDYVRLVDMTCADEQPPTGEGQMDCPTVTNANMADSAGWILSGTAAITNGLATLSRNDGIAQPVTLQANMTYNGVISISRIISGLGNVIMGVRLGDQIKTVDIAPTGLYTVPFLTPANLAGPLVFSISNTTGGEFDVDYACLTTETGDRACLAPTNGAFTTADHWQWYRGAGWNAPTKSAALPYNPGDDAEKSLILSTNTYTLPTPATGQYVLLGYLAQSQTGQAAVLSGKVGNAELFQDVYASPYIFEADISRLAGQNVSVAFSNSGGAGFTAEDGVLLDDVCIWLSNRPPALAGPRDGGGGILPVDFGFTYGCLDTAALLAGYGINIYNQSAIYQAGVSVWEPQNYITWLAAALWVNVGAPVTCFLVEFMRLFAGVSQHFVNVFLNYINFTRLTYQSGILWQQSGAFMLRDTVHNYGLFVQGLGQGWLNWFAAAQRTAINSAGQNWAGLGTWISDFAGWQGSYFEQQLTGQTNRALNVLLTLWNSRIVPYLEQTTSIAPPDTSQFIGDYWGGLTAGWEMILAMGNLVWFGITWFFGEALAMAKFPLTIYEAFKAGLNGNAYALGFSINCSDINFWCVFLSGAVLLNKLGDQVLYPIVITLMTVATISIVWRNIDRLADIDIG